MTGRQSALIAGGATCATMLARRLLDGRRLNLEGRTALVTGGSRGLGLLIARELGRHGARVVIVARDEFELERAINTLRASHVMASAIVADLRVAADAMQIVEETVSRYGHLDILVNNAGVITVGPIEHATLADFDEAMAVHLWAPLHTMQAAIPHMRRAGGGRIVNVSSIGGRIGVPHLAPYCASKFALTGLSASMRAELIKDNILVTTVCPGLMRTGSPFNARFKGRHREEFAWFAISDSLPLLSVDARRAARQIVDATRRGDADLVIGWPAKLAIALSAAIPDTFAAVMGLANRVLPPPSDERGGESYSGWQSTSAWAPSPLTRLTERAAAANNEIPQ